MNEQVGWLSTRAGEVFAGLRLPVGARRATTVVFVPPFGWEGMSASRNLKAWGRELAADGYPVVRYQPPGAGDSAGLGVDQDLDSWVRALTDVLAHARTATAASHVTVIALGLGGLVALQAQHEGAGIDDLVLWSVPSKGRLLLREARAFASMAIEPGEATGAAPAAEVPTDDGSLWVHGYPISARFQEQLKALDTTVFGVGALRRAYVLGRGTLPADRALVAALEKQGVLVEVAPGPGYDELTVEPRLSRSPVVTQAAVLGWLNNQTGVGEPGAWGTVPYLEQRLDLGDVDAILTTAEDPSLTAIFIGAGAIARSGPGRLWAEAAGRWADLGVSSLRLDLYGIGEAPGPDANPMGDDGFHDVGFRRQVESTMDHAVRLGLPDRFLLVGLCSGGFWAGQVALDDPRVVGVVILNPGSLVWPPPLVTKSGVLLNRELWSKFWRDPLLRKEFWARFRRLAKALLSRLRPAGPRPPRRSLQVLEALEANGTHVMVALSAGEMNEMDLDLHRSSPSVVVHHFRGATAAHTLSPIALRRQAESLLDEQVREVLKLVAEQPAGR